MRAIKPWVQAALFTTAALIFALGSISIAMSRSTDAIRPAKHAVTRSRSGVAAGAPRTPQSDACLREVPIVERVTNSGLPTYVAEFTGSPEKPRPLCPAQRFDVQVHSRDSGTWMALEPIEALHGPHCAGPPATHVMAGDYRSAVFQCRDHVMTSINASGYGVIYLTPDRMVDFSKGGAISFDVSTRRASTRDWIDVWITPFDQNLALPFDDGDVDLQGVPRTAIHITNGNSQGNWTVATIRDFKARELFNSWDGTPFDRDISPGTNQDATRQTYRISLSRTHLKMERLPSESGASVVFFDQDVPDVGFDRAVVQFGHHSYNPTKDGAGKPATWHWDNLAVQPAVPFTIINADRRYIDSADQSITVAKPAPKDAYLRFSAIGVVEVSFDGGRWQQAQKGVASKNVDGYHPEHLSSYWTPMPQGASSVRLRFSRDSWYEGPFIAKDFAVWSETVE